MKVAALYDIHGNLPALEAVLAEIDQIGIDEIVVGGDVLLGPMPAECMNLLLELDIPTYFIRGNCETSVSDYLDEKSPGPLPERAIRDIHWTADQLASVHRKAVAAWPLTIQIAVKELGNVLFCHATPRNEFDIFTIRTAEDKLVPLFDLPGVDVVVCGHTHMQFDRMVGRVRVVNSGSVGMPFGKMGAFWILLDREIEFKKTKYNFKAAADRIINTTYPFAKEFAMNNVLSVPSEKEMLEKLMN